MYCVLLTDVPAPALHEVVQGVPYHTVDKVYLFIYELHNSLIVRRHAHV